jgi:hypothetical protein
MMWAFVLGVGTQMMPAHAIHLGIGGGAFGDLVKLFGIGWVVTHYGSQINDTINTVLKQHDAEIHGLTRVVPVVAFGHGGTAVGAVQIMGDEGGVKQAQAVAELEVAMSRLRGRGLVPISTSVPGSSLKAIPGVGVSTDIKFPL